ncbi:MAG: UvrB/UvrC motif-containing protein, partial [Bacilli bacterium]|nr:UvrB/UvrC motif-containing protein [Bacilli bacterium]
KKNNEKVLKEIEREMLKAAKNLDFEKATELRDILFEMKIKYSE